MARAPKRPATGKTPPKPKPAKEKAKPKASAKPRAAAKPRSTPAKPPATTKAVAAAKPKAAKPPARTKPPARAKRPTRSKPPTRATVVELLDDADPIGALRGFLASVEGEATAVQAQIALGTAQLMLPDTPDQRGNNEVRELVDLVLAHWDVFGDRRSGFHALEFLSNALAAIGNDRERLARLAERIPDRPPAELLVSLASAHAIAGDKAAMLRAVERGLDAGASAEQLRRAPALGGETRDPDLLILLARAEAPAIPVDVKPCAVVVRAALDHLEAALEELGEPAALRPALRLENILDAERAGKISLPNDYRALLAISNGATIWHHEFFGAEDFRQATPLAAKALEFLRTSTERGNTAFASCVPVASWPDPAGWLVYDAVGGVRGAPGYAVVSGALVLPLHDLASALARIERGVRDALATN